MALTTDVFLSIPSSRISLWFSGCSHKESECQSSHILQSLTTAMDQQISKWHWRGLCVGERRRSLFVGCLTSQRQASVSQGRICSDNFTCCHTEIEVADQSFYLTQSQYTDTRLTSPSADPIMSGAWQGSHWSANFWVTGMTQPGKIPSQAGFKGGEDWKICVFHLCLLHADCAYNIRPTEQITLWIS